MITSPAATALLADTHWCRASDIHESQPPENAGGGELDLFAGALDRLDRQAREGLWGELYFARMHLRGLLAVALHALRQHGALADAQQRLTQLRQRALEVHLLTEEDLEWADEHSHSRTHKTPAGPSGRAQSAPHGGPNGSPTAAVPQPRRLARGAVG